MTRKISGDLIFAIEAFKDAHARIGGAICRKRRVLFCRARIGAIPLRFESAKFAIKLRAKRASRCGISSYGGTLSAILHKAGVYRCWRISVSVRTRAANSARGNDKIMEADHDGWKHFSRGGIRALSDSRTEFHPAKTTCRLIGSAKKNEREERSLLNANLRSKAYPCS